MPPGGIEKIRVVALHGMGSADIHVGRALDFERLVQSVEQHDVLTLLRKCHAAEFGDGLTASPRRLGNRSSRYTGYQTGGEITSVHVCLPSKSTRVAGKFATGILISFRRRHRKSECAVHTVDCIKPPTWTFKSRPRAECSGHPPWKDHATRSVPKRRGLHQFEVPRSRFGKFRVCDTITRLTCE